LAIRSVPLLAAYFVASDKIVAGYTSPVSRNLYAVNQSPKNRGTISVYDIDARHRLIKTINTVPDIGDVRGVAASAATGKLYVAILRAVKLHRLPREGASFEKGAMQALAYPAA